MTYLGMCGRAVPPDVKVKLVLLLPAAGVKVYLGKRLNRLAKTRLWVLSMVFHILCPLIIKSWLDISNVETSELICGRWSE